MVVFENFNYSEIIEQISLFGRVFLKKQKDLNTQANYLNYLYVKIRILKRILCDLFINRSHPFVELSGKFVIIGCHNLHLMDN